MSYLYVALGDSLTTGVGASIFSPGFVQRYQRLALMELNDFVYVQTFSHPGFQSHDVLLEFEKEFVREQIKNADIITITAGGNDLIQAARKYQEDKNEKDFSIALSNCMDNISKIMKKITKLKHDSISPYIVRILNLYNPFPQDPLAVKWINQFNSELRKFVRKPTISVADVEKVFKSHETEYLSFDGIHPNDVGYEKIATTLNRMGYGELPTEIEEE